jgi:hypothetical protein
LLPTGTFRFAFALTPSSTKLKHFQLNLKFQQKIGGELFWCFLNGQLGDLGQLSVDLLRFSDF